MGTLHRSAPWLCADWVNYGEAQYGEKYTQALDVTGLSPERLRALSWIGNRYKPARRRPELSFEAHRELAYIKDDKEQDAILDKAVREGWGAREIREWKREQRGEETYGTNLILATFSFEDDVDANAAFHELSEKCLEVADDVGALVRFRRPKSDD